MRDRQVPWDAARSASRRPLRKYKPVGPVGPTRVDMQDHAGELVNGVPVPYRAARRLTNEYEDNACRHCGHVLCSCTPEARAERDRESVAFYQQHIQEHVRAFSGLNSVVRGEPVLDLRVAGKQLTATPEQAKALQRPYSNVMFTGIDVGFCDQSIQQKAAAVTFTPPSGDWGLPTFEQLSAFAEQLKSEPRLPDVVSGTLEDITKLVAEAAKARPVDVKKFLYMKRGHATYLVSKYQVYINPHDEERFEELLTAPAYAKLLTIQTVVGPLKVVADPNVPPGRVEFRQPLPMLGHYDTLPPEPYVPPGGSWIAFHMQIEQERARERQKAFDAHREEVIKLLTTGEWELL